MSNVTLHKLYNPHQIPKELLIKSFVIRTKEFDKIFKDISNYNIKKSNQHFIIQGQRGVGKSTMLLRLNYEMEKLEDKLPILFDEEEYGITSLEEVWERVWEIIEENNYFTIPDNVPLDYKTLEKLLKEHNKILVLLIDNIGDLLENFDDENDEYILREVLQKNKYIKVVGGSPYALETYYTYDKPFYDFFNVITLGGLKYEDTLKYLKSLGETYDEKNINYVLTNNPKRIKILNIITGGNPRTIGLLLEIFANDKDGTVFQDLEKLLDSVTALYKHRMEELSKQHRKIVSAIAQKWESVSVKELVEITKLESKVISAQLNKLVKNDVIEVVPTKTKNNLYCIKERFFNIWYLMRYKKKNADKIRWLIEFMDIWYNDIELKDKITIHIDKMKNDDYLTSESVKMTEALGLLAKKRIDNKSFIHTLYLSNIDLLHKKNKYEEYSKNLSYTEEDVVKEISSFIFSFSNDKFNNPREETKSIMRLQKLLLTLALLSLLKKIEIPSNELVLKVDNINAQEFQYYCLALLEENKFDFLLKFILKFYGKDKYGALSIILIGLVAKKQFNIISQLFKSNKEIQMKFLVFYFLNFKFNGNEDEFNKIPKEILSQEMMLNKDLKFFQDKYNDILKLIYNEIKDFRVTL